NAGVTAMAAVGGTVYVAGDFTIIGGATRTRIAAIDATTGLATGWDPDANNEVHALAATGDPREAGGYLTRIGGTAANGRAATIGGAARNNVAALDATTGLATGWNPNANGQVRTLAMSGSTIYAGGSFTAVGGATRFRTAALDATTGLATAWTSHANGAVYALA